MAHKLADSYADCSHVATAQAAQEVEPAISTCSPSQPEERITASIQQKCFLRGFDRHPRSKCPAKDATCNNCSNLAIGPNAVGSADKAIIL